MLEKIFGPEELNVILNLILCLLAGLLIGVERESRGKDAGISTHTLVIFGSMLFTFLSIHMDPSSPSRIAAQVVTGIGFLGAGLIIRDKTTVKNLTTAASIWFAAAIGMCFGFGYYVIGIIATLASFFIPRMPHLTKYHKHLWFTTTK